MYKQTCYAASLLFCLCSFTLASAHQSQAILDYVEQYKNLAISEMHRSGIPASITLAQGILESTYGIGELAVKSNNHFGIKCKSEWQGNVYHKEDDDFINGKLIKSCFRAYQTAEESYIDHSNFLRNSMRYATLFRLDRSDYKGWAKGLQGCGYATDPTYANKLIGTIERYQLHQYDSEEAVNPTDRMAALAAPYVEQGAGSTPSNIDLLAPPPAEAIPDDYKRAANRPEIRTPDSYQISNSEEVPSPIQSAPSTAADTDLPIGQKGLRLVQTAPEYDISNYWKSVSSASLELAVDATINFSATTSARLKNESQPSAVQKINSPAPRRFGPRMLLRSPKGKRIGRR